MTDYAMAEIKKNKGTNNDMQGATQTNTDRATRIMWPVWSAIYDNHNWIINSVY